MSSTFNGFIEFIFNGVIAETMVATFNVFIVFS